MRIGKLVKRGITSFTYTYNFGDDWRHRIEIEEITPQFPASITRDLSMANVVLHPKTSAEPRDFEEFLNAMAKPRHPERTSMVQ